MNGLTIKQKKMNLFLRYYNHAGVLTGLKLEFVKNLNGIFPQIVTKANFVIFELKIELRTSCLFSPH